MERRIQKVVQKTMPLSHGIVQRKCACGTHTIGGSDCATCAKKEETLQRQAAHDNERAQATTAVPESVHQVLLSPGQSLDTATRSFMESRFGHDFSDVRAHTDAQAAESARAVNALAYTVGRDVVFGAGQFAPHTTSGKRLLGHELAHVVQQRGASTGGMLSMGDPASPLESEADSAAHGLGEAQLSETSRASLQRQRQPEDTKPRNVGPPLNELPLPPRCSFILQDGKWSWKCESVPVVGSTPKLPVDPRDIPGRIEDIFKGKDKKPSSPPPGGTRPAQDPEMNLPQNWVEQTCKLTPLSEFCVRFGKTYMKEGADKKKPVDVMPQPIGVFWTFNVLFDHDQPSLKESRPNGGMTEEGASSLNTNIYLLQRDPSMQVRIIGHASSEGDTAHNLELSKRRARFIYRKLEEAKLGGRVINPVVSDGKTDGCTRLDPGVWACGELNATPGEARPEERKIEMTFLRNPQMQMRPLKLTMPEFIPPRAE